MSTVFWLADIPNISQIQILVTFAYPSVLIFVVLKCRLQRLVKTESWKKPHKK